MRRVLTNAVWAALEPLVEASRKSNAGTTPELSDRDFLEGLLHLARTGEPWRDVPEEFGDYNSLFQRFKRWRKSGRFERLFAALPTDHPIQDIKRLFRDVDTATPTDGEPTP